MKRLQLKIYGRVQGVFYRAETCVKAQKLGLTGWVRNNTDGTVEILSEGKEEDLRTLLTWCKEGPSDAQVEKIEETWDTYKDAFDSFDIRY